MSKYIIGIDGGGTKTLGVLFDELGVAVKRVTNGFANFSADEEISKMNIERTIDSLVEGISSEDKLLHIQLGIAGHSKLIKKEEYVAHLTYKYETSVDMVNDALIALYSVKRDTDMPVIMVLGGTGSVIMISNEEGTSIIGGFGHLLGDEGSSYHLSITALQDVISQFENSLPFTKLSTALMSVIDADNHYGISKFVYNNTKSDIAKLSLFVEKQALQGDKDAIKLFIDEGKHLARQTQSACQKLDTKEKIIIGIKGGFLLNAPYVKETLISELNNCKINYEISKEQVEPVVGAYYLGLKKITKE